MPRPLMIITVVLYPLPHHNKIENNCVVPFASEKVVRTDCNCGRLYMLTYG